MRNNVESANTDPLLLAYMPDATTIPTQFTISCFLCLKSKGVFENSVRCDDLIIACGTFQGPIIIVGIKDNAIHPISLLCGHSYPITDFTETIHDSSFLSISSECTVCNWSTLDGSCLFKFDLPISSLKEYKISICPSEISLVWIWAVGSGLYLFNFEKKEIIYSLSVGGLCHFSIISPHTSCCVSTTVAVVLTINMLKTFQLNDSDQSLNEASLSECEISPNILQNESIYVCSRGLIKVYKIEIDQQNLRSDENTVEEENFLDKNVFCWEIIRPNENNVIIATGKFFLDKDDDVFGVDWSFTSYFCISSYKACFLIIKLNRFVDSITGHLTLSVVSKQTFCWDNSFLSCFTYFINSEKGENKIVMSPDSKSIAIISFDDSSKIKNKTVFIFTEKKCFFRNNLSCRQYFHNCFEPIIFYSQYSTLNDSNSDIYIYDCIKQKITDMFECDSVITAIHSRNAIMSSTKQVITGHENGSISFWNILEDKNSTKSLGKSTKSLVKIGNNNDSNAEKNDHILNKDNTDIKINILENDQIMREGDLIENGNCITHTLAKINTFFTFSTAVIAFVEFPFKHAGRPIVLAVGRHSCCLFKWNELYSQFDLGDFFILSIFFIEDMSLLIIGVNDGSFTVYNFQDSTPLYILSQVPSNAILLYSQCSQTEKLFSDNVQNDKFLSSFFADNSPLVSSFLSLNQICLMRILGKPLLYQLFNVSKLVHSIENNQNTEITQRIMKLINIILNPGKEKEVLDMISNDESNDVLLMPKNPSIVIIGYDLIPTFYYHPFSMNFSNIIHSSPLIYAEHFLMNQLFSSFNDSNNEKEKNEITKNDVDLLPIFLKMLYSNDINVQKIAARTCASLSGFITFNKTQEFVAPFIFNERYTHEEDFKDSDKFLLSLLASKYNNLIPPELHPKLHHFLKLQDRHWQNKNIQDLQHLIQNTAKTQVPINDDEHNNIQSSNQNEIGIHNNNNNNKFNLGSNNGNNENTLHSSAVSAMATFILIDGITFWKKFEENIEELYFKLISSVLKNQKQFDFLYKRFIAFVYSDIPFMKKILCGFIKLHSRFIDSKSYNNNNMNDSNNVQKNEGILCVNLDIFLIESVLHLYSVIELANPKLVGGMMSYAIAKAGIKFPFLSDISLSILLNLSETLSYIDVHIKESNSNNSAKKNNNKNIIDFSKSLIVIGTSNGLVYIFVDLACKVKFKVFTGQICNVSISPNARNFIVLSDEELCGEIFQLKAPKNVIHKIDISPPIPSTKYSITWICEDNASVSFVNK